MLVRFDHVASYIVNANHSIIFAVLFRRFVRSKTKVLYRPDWQALRIIGKRSKISGAKSD
jgi:hypothetical protein